MAYSAYIFKALAVTSAWGLCEMHPEAEGWNNQAGGP